MWKMLVLLSALQHAPVDMTPGNAGGNGGDPTTGLKAAGHAELVKGNAEFPDHVVEDYRKQFVLAGTRGLDAIRSLVTSGHRFTTSDGTALNVGLPHIDDAAVLLAAIAEPGSARLRLRRNLVLGGVPVTAINYPGGRLELDPGQWDQIAKQYSGVIAEGLREMVAVHELLSMIDHPLERTGQYPVSGELVAAAQTESNETVSCCLCQRHVVLETKRHTPLVSYDMSSNQPHVQVLGTTNYMSVNLPASRCYEQRRDLEFVDIPLAPSGLRHVYSECRVVTLVGSRCALKLRGEPRTAYEFDTSAERVVIEHPLLDESVDPRRPLVTPLTVTRNMTSAYANRRLRLVKTIRGSGKGPAAVDLLPVKAGHRYFIKPRFNGWRIHITIGNPAVSLPVKTKQHFTAFKKSFARPPIAVEDNLQRFWTDAVYEGPYERGWNPVWFHIAFQAARDGMAAVSTYIDDTDPNWDYTYDVFEIPANL